MVGADLSHNVLFFIDNISRLGMHAFYTVLSKKPAIYGTSTLLKYLQFQVSLSRNKQLRRRMRNVVKDGLLGVAALNF
jgi:hypothetical protein